MALSQAEAQSTLKDIEKTENRAAASQHGRFAAPHLISWGVVWIIGYLATALAPQFAWMWFPLVIGGVVSSYLIDRFAVRGRTGSSGTSGMGWRYGASFVAIFIFIFALFSILQPREMNQISAFYPLVIGLYYTFMGIWTRGWRMLPLGVALTALTIAGYYLLPDYFNYWMAAVGGGGLVLGGLWLRSV
jgi:hypothetical protein